MQKESSQKQEIQEKPALTEEKPKTEEPRNVLIPEVTVAVPQVEISVEDQKVQEENEKNNEKTEEVGFQLKYKYKEGVFSYNLTWLVLLVMFTAFYQIFQNE